MVSVITISNAREELIKTFRGVLRSIINSKFQNTEYIIVEATEGDVKDDLSSILASEGIDGFPVSIKHVKLKKGGFSLQRNIGVMEAKNDIVVFIDDGMEVPDTWLKYLVSPITSGEAEAVLGGVIPKISKRESKSLYKDIENILILSQAVLGFPAGGMKLLARGRTYIDSFSTSNLAILRSLVIEAGMFDESLKFGAEDSDLSIRIKRTFPGARFLYEPAALVFAEPRRNLNDIKKWFIRRGKSFASLVKKYERNRFKQLIRREILLPKLISIFLIPFVSLPFAVLYVSQAERTLKLSSKTELFPKEYKRMMRFLLPFIKLYMDIYYSIGYYSEIIRP